jgi:hypothetical protein
VDIGDLGGEDIDAEGVEQQATKRKGVGVGGNVNIKAR